MTRYQETTEDVERHHIGPRERHDGVSPYDCEADDRVAQVFKSDALYFRMLQQWHDDRGGIAIEPEVKSHIEAHCAPGACILEAGSGAGNITNWFAGHYPRSHFIGVDISPLGALLARDRAARNATFVVADLKRLPFPDAMVDFVFCQSVLEHVVGWDTALMELHRVLRPGGSLLVRLTNAGVHGRSLRGALVDYVLRQNRIQQLTPSFRLSSATDWRRHMTNYDVQEIPSDVLLDTLRRSGFFVRYFTTGTHRWRRDRDPRTRLVSYLPFWPFSHLGPTSIVLVTKAAPRDKVTPSRV